MSFNVTQCPACESTFNTNSRVLAAAAGRVRCGACLNVFEAIDNFLITDEADSEQNQNESVFVGNDPQEFFDPSSFLTRSALSEPHDAEAGRAEPIDEHILHQELEQSETVSEDFFATVAEELQDRAEMPSLDDISEDNEQQIDQSEGQHADKSNEHIDERFEEEILDSFATEATEASEPIESEKDYASLEEHTESESTSTDVEEMHFESTESFLGTGLSASFTFNPHGSANARIGESEEDSPLVENIVGEQPIDANTASRAESNEDTGQPLLDMQEEALEADVQEAHGFSQSQSDDELEDSTASEDATPAITAADATSDSLITAESTAELEPSAVPAAYKENIGVSTEAPSYEADDIETLTQQEELASESAVEDEELSTAVEQASAEEVDEESTEAIRSRALEAELNDEEALEAIPLENLAALGSMSTPVELLARKESRLVRSTLLFLSILLLGSLLSSQYLWQRADLYSQLPQFRSLYEVACGYLNCALPEYTDIDSIRSENLTVQTHPTLANGLMVNTVMRNTSAFEQPFPILILSFNSVENSVIALREFTPAEYLGPGLHSVQAMPAKTPVQIGLAIMDPGPEAVNYTLAFRWP